MKLFLVKMMNRLEIFVREITKKIQENHEAKIESVKKEAFINGFNWAYHEYNEQSEANVTHEQIIDYLEMYTDIPFHQSELSMLFNSGAKAAILELDGDFEDGEL